jgi:predicted ferric reductase
VIAETTKQLAWFVARSSGIVAWALVTASIVWGLAVSSRPTRRRGVHGRTLDLHQFLAVLSIVFTSVHVLSLVADNWVHFGWRELFVPMASTYRPGAVAWGIVGLYLLGAIVLTSWAMRWLPRRVWRSIHMTSLLLFAIATVHGLTAGTDGGNRAVQLVTLGGVALVIALLVFRILATAQRRVGGDGVRRQAPARVEAVRVDAVGGARS